MAKIYTQAPLPFIGQKRNFIAHFKQILKVHLPADGAGWTIVDAFGGSGLLSHTAKAIKPAARVIYNDFDGYAQRLTNIPHTNRLRQQLAAILQDYPRQQRLDAATKAAVHRIIRRFDGPLDLDALTSWLLFSGKQAASLDELLSHTMYNTLRRSDYPEASGYLNGLEITRLSYRELLPAHINQPNTLLVLDPPYVCTKQGAYRLAGYFGMVEFLRLMSMVRPPFVFFSSTRSELLAYLDLLVSERLPGWERFAGYQTVSINASINKDAAYEDNLVFKF